MSQRSGRQRGAGQAKRRSAAAERDALKTINARLVRAGPSPDGKGFDMEFRAAEQFVQGIAANMLTWFDGERGTNYVSFEIAHKTRGRFAFSLQRVAGKTPHQLRLDAEKERDALRKVLEDTRSRLSGTRWESRAGGRVDEGAPGINWPFVIAAIDGLDAALKGTT